MTERELLQSMASARHALALASWNVARAAMAEGPSEEDPLTPALKEWRQARRSLGRARADWHRRVAVALDDSRTGT